MDINHAVISLSALSQETRLQVFKLLIEYGPEGTPAGKLSKQLGIPHNTMSFHLAHLSHAGLVKSKRDGRSITYIAQSARIESLLEFLVENCCVRGKAQDCCPPAKKKKKSS